MSGIVYDTGALVAAERCHRGAFDVIDALVVATAFATAGAGGLQRPG
ncbi:MAG: hypothetical protein ACRDRX_16675 [Pseudonocardiaceae bacterium]